MQKRKETIASFYLHDPRPPVPRYYFWIYRFSAPVRIRRWAVISYRRGLYCDIWLGSFPHSVILLEDIVWILSVLCPGSYSIDPLSLVRCDIWLGDFSLSYCYLHPVAIGFLRDPPITDYCDIWLGDFSIFYLNEPYQRALMDLFVL
jgi:hypothetical protein